MSSRSTSPRLTLFVAGDEPNSTRARSNLRRILADHFDSAAEVDEVNVLTDFRQAIEHGVSITPALVITGMDRPLTIYGDLSEEQEVIASLRPALVPHG
jgi:hypothetical protein